MRTPSTLRTLLNRAQSSNVTPSYLVMVKITKRVVEAAEPPKVRRKLRRIRSRSPNPVSRAISSIGSRHRRSRH
jgi:hypothetical protein